MIRVLVVEDDDRVARLHVGFAEQVPGFAVAGTAGTADGAVPYWPGSRSTCCCSTRTCPASPAWTCSPRWTSTRSC